MDLVTVRAYSFQPEAALAKNLLESEGIPAMLSEEFAGEMLHLGNEIKLVVPADQAKRAAEILDGAERHRLTKDAAAAAEEHANDEVDGQES
jgi:hypothetical protein